MKNILLIFTGGTIGSTLNNGQIDTDGNSRFLLLERYRQLDPQAEQILFTCVTAGQILSENLHPEFWKTLLDCIESHELSQYHGIIITHGTDTLAYTAAMLSVYFANVTIPMLLVSSDRPLQDPLANGLGNFKTAVDFIRQNYAPGVFVSYRNPGQAQQIHLGSRLLSCLPLGSDFISVPDGAWLSVHDGQFQPHHALPVAPPVVKLQARFAPILLLRPYPGLDYQHIDLSPYAAVLHDLYHSGTACVSRQWGAQHSLIAFAQRCQQLGKPLYLAPALYSENAYASTRELLDNGVQMLWDVTLETAYAKLVLGFGNFGILEFWNFGNSTDTKAFLSVNIAIQ